jgi:DNA-binding SARP family transcriptional activator
MLQLTTFGGLEVDRTDRPLSGAAVRPRPLALLALVGSAREGGVSRDRLLAYFWPESDTEHARNSLKQTLFALRRDLQDDLFVTRNGSLRLNPAVITTDGLQFEAARARGAHGNAVALYRGPFLDGFHIPSLLEFEHWMESERLRLARCYRASLEALATTAYEGGDWRAAVEWWRQLTTVEPLCSRVALRFMRALVATGARTEALEYARRYEGLVRSELDAPPDAAVTAYAQWLGHHPEARLRRWSHTPVAGPNRPTGPTRVRADNPSSAG